MTHTVVGLFDSKSDAQKAMQELIQQGFVQQNIDLSSRRTSDSYDTSGGTQQSATNTSSGFADSVSNFFNSLFGDDETTARNYNYAASEAEAILTVQVDSAERAAQARDILDRNGAIDVDERGAQYNEQYATGQNYAQTTGATENRAQTENKAAIPVIEEQLQVGKQQVERGGARIRSRVVKKPVEESVRLREEHVVVNRRPVDRPATEADLANVKEGEIELTERAEVPVVAKQARVVEEVEVGKNVTEREETVRDTVRRTNVDVQEVDTNTTTTGGTDVNTRTAKS